MFIIKQQLLIFLVIVNLIYKIKYITLFIGMTDKSTIVQNTLPNSNYAKSQFQRSYQNTNQPNSQSIRSQNKRSLLQIDSFKKKPKNIPENHININSNNVLDYDIYKQIIENNISNKPKLTDLPHDELYRLLQKALLGLNINYKGNLTQSIEPFYDLEQIAKEYQVQSPCINQSRNCHCIIGDLLKQQIFINIANYKQTEQNVQVKDDVKDMIEGKLSTNIGQSLLNNIFKLDISASSSTNSSKSSLFNIKKYVYCYGYIILKKSIFTNRFLRKQIVRLRNKLIGYKGVHQNSEKEKTKSQALKHLKKSSREMNIIEQFANEFGDVIPTKVEVGVYVVKYKDQKTQTESKLRNFQADIKISGMTQANIDTKNENVDNSKNINNNLIVVLDPTIIKRQNYVSTNELAEVYQQTEQTLIKYYIQSKVYILLAQKAGSEKKYLVKLNQELNIKQITTNDKNIQNVKKGFKSEPYNYKDIQQNRLHTIAFYQAKSLATNKSKYLIRCTLLGRRIKVEQCNIYIRSIKYQNSELKYFEIDQISFNQNFKDQYLVYENVSHSQLINRHQCVPMLQTTQQLCLSEVEQNNCLLILQPLQTKNDIQLKESYKIMKENEIENEKRK